MNAPRLGRRQQVVRNREQLLDAARRVFVERGFHAATLDAIADAAGFSKGVVYSQFDSKADLFLALLERRIDERAAENARVAAGDATVVELLATARRTTAAEPAWNLLLLEFRVHAARDPEINARYAALHERTRSRLAAALREATARGAGRAIVAPEAMASFVLAFGAGTTLEALVAPLRPAQEESIAAMVARALGFADDGAAVARARPPTGGGTKRARRTT